MNVKTNITGSKIRYIAFEICYFLNFAEAKAIIIQKNLLIQGIDNQYNKKYAQKIVLNF